MMEAAATSRQSAGLNDRDSLILLIESVIILILSIVSCTWVCLTIIHRNWLSRGAESRRDRDIRRFLDFSVFVLMAFDLVQSINWLAGTLIAWVLYDRGGPGLGSSRPHLLHVCKVIGGMTYFVDLVLYMWNAALAFSLYSWVVRKALLRNLRDRMRASLIVIILLSLLLTLVPAATDAFGAHPNATCWLKDLSLNGLSITLNKSVLLPLCLLLIGGTYLTTVSHLRHQLDNGAPSAASYSRLRTRLLCFMVIFFACWVMNSIWYYLLAMDKAHVGLGVFAKFYLGIGLYDAVVYTYNSSNSPSSASYAAEARGRGSDVYSSRGQGVGTLEGPILTSEGALSETYHNAGRYRIFCTSYNCGGCTHIHRLGRVEDWIPCEAYDVYAISLQECRILPRIKKAILDHLGGPSKFHLFNAEIGDTVVGNGKIALLVYVRVSSGFKPVVSGKGQVNHGINLGVSRFHNKGGVGLAFQCGSTAIAFIATHFASDSGGKKRLEKRNEDASRTLRSIFLTGDEEEFDVHQQHHHAIIMGDMNYRSDAFCDEVLVKVRQSAAMEMDHYRDSSLGWREGRYERFFTDSDETGGNTSTVGGVMGTAYAPTMLSGLRQEPLGEERDEDVEHWDWVQTMDELTISMRRGLAFDEFQEGVVRFPPSFKLWPGRTIEDYSELADLRYGYQMQKAVPGMPYETRAPSWTDRILFYSLPDLRPKLKLLDYDMCDAITGSDHRPVSAAFQLLVDENHGLVDLDRGSSCNLLSALPTPPPLMAHAEASATGDSSIVHEDVELVAVAPSPVQVLAPQAHEDSGLGGTLVQVFRRASSPPPVPPIADALPPPPPLHHAIEMDGVSACMGLGELQLVQVKMKHFHFFFCDDQVANPVTHVDLVSGDAEALSSGSYGLLHPPSQLDLLRGETSMLSVTSGPHSVPSFHPMLGLDASGISTTATQASNGPVQPRREDEIARVTVLLPIPCEDPFLATRRVEMLEPAGAIMPPISMSTSAAAAPGMQGARTEAAVWKDRKHLHRFSWPQVLERGGLKLTTTVKKSSGIHALIKFHDRTGKALGQGVVCIRELLRASEHHSGYEGGQTRYRSTVVNLSVGGVKVGEVSLEVSATRGRRGSSRRRPPVPPVTASSQNTETQRDSEDEDEGSAEPEGTVVPEGTENTLVPH